MILENKSLRSVNEFIKVAFIDGTNAIRTYFRQIRGVAHTVRTFRTDAVWLVSAVAVWCGLAHAIRNLVVVATRTRDVGTRDVGTRDLRTRDVRAGR